MFINGQSVCEGDQGEIGPKGDPGAQGEAGVPGTQGPQRESGATEATSFEGLNSPSQLLTTMEKPTARY